MCTMNSVTDIVICARFWLRVAAVLGSVLRAVLHAMPALLHAMPALLAAYLPAALLAHFKTSAK